MSIRTAYIGLLICWLLVEPGKSCSQTAMVNFTGRDKIMLNGNWQVMVDPFCTGDAKQVGLERMPGRATNFVEYSFDGGPFLKVPGAFNTQRTELNLYEGVVWYQKQVQVRKKPQKRYFLYFGAVNYLADVFFNGVKLGSHEGGFTPFQFEITGLLADSSNAVIVKADSRRRQNGLPGLGFDWFNYGGITRDVAIIATEDTYIKDYFIQLKKGSIDTISGWVKLEGPTLPARVTISIPEIKLRYILKTDHGGYATIQCKAGLQYWSPQNPKRYRVLIEAGDERLVDTIGFRNIEVKGNDVLLNGRKIFLKAVNIHEENPLKRSRITNEGDAALLLSAAKALGCNMVRLVHYPHNEAMVQVAERMGLMVWSEMPVYQHIDFSDSTVPRKIIAMQQEMVTRDKNRCAVIVWALSNETYPGTANRDAVLIRSTAACRKLDDTRLVVHVANTQGYTHNILTVWDSIYHYSDLVAVNEYMGWYQPWQGQPGAMKWDTRFPGKPLFISEFGGEALWGNRSTPSTGIAVWTEEFQRKIYEDQIRMFERAPGLCGVAPWILFDYKSPVRMNQVFQKGYNRKGLLSKNGNKKQAWYIINNYYKRQGNAR